MTDRVNFEGTYKTLVEKFLKKNWQAEDWIPEEYVSNIEENLGFKLPAAVREYYKTVGNADDLNESHNYLTGLNELPHILFDFKNQPEALFNVDEDWHADEDFLIFMTGNQSVVYWGLKMDSIKQRIRLFGKSSMILRRSFIPKKKRSRNLLLKCLTGNTVIKK